MEVLGKAVKVKIIRDLSNHNLSGVRAGQVKPAVDWLVGCPLFVDSKTGKVLGVGYECEVLEILAD